MLYQSDAIAGLPVQYPPTYSQEAPSHQEGFEIRPQGFEHRQSVNPRAPRTLTCFGLYDNLKSAFPPFVLRT
jgi:hypothetical protein